MDVVDGAANELFKNGLRADVADQDVVGLETFIKLTEVDQETFNLLITFILALL